MAKIFLSLANRFIGGKKMLVWFVSLTASALRSKFPDLPVPSDEFLIDLGLAYLAAHSITDVAHISKTAVLEFLAGRAVQAKS